MTELPPLNSLRAFDAAGRRLSFRAAADELGVTQGAVAQQVRQLEAHLGWRQWCQCCRRRPSARHYAATYLSVASGTEAKGIT